MARPRNRTMAKAVPKDARDEKDYDVGYGRPPKETRFPPGRSGNPGGRPPKKTKEAQSSLEAELEVKVQVVGSDGRKIFKTRRQLAYVQIATKAAKGDHRSILIVLEHDRRRAAGEANPDPFKFDPELVQTVLGQYEQEVLSRAPSTPPGVG